MADSPDILILPLTGIDEMPPRPRNACSSANTNGVSTLVTGLSFTGGNFHSGWANNDQRKLVLNAILLTAKAAVPPKGVESVVTEEDLKQNLDPKP